MMLALSQAIVIEAELKIAVLSDIHLNPEYDPDISEVTYCHGDGLAAKEQAFLGRRGCDSPLTLLKMALEVIKSENPDLDVLLVPGDFIGHAYPLDGAKGNYQKLIETHKMIRETLVKYFPNTMILPSLGNNDTKFHY